MLNELMRMLECTLAAHPALDGLPPCRRCYAVFAGLNVSWHQVSTRPATPHPKWRRRAWPQDMEEQMLYVLELVNITYLAVYLC